MRRRGFESAVVIVRRAMRFRCRIFSSPAQRHYFHFGGKSQHDEVSNIMASSQSQAAQCDACGLPPRDPNKPLLLCARCKSAHYHDATCQKNHYPIHKAECHRAEALSAASVSSQLKSSTQNGSDASHVILHRKSSMSQSLFICIDICIHNIVGCWESIHRGQRMVVRCNNCLARWMHYDGLYKAFVVHPVLFETYHDAQVQQT